MTTPTPDPRELIRELVDALDHALDDTRESVREYHHTMRGYRPREHEKLDAELAGLEATLTKAAAYLSTPVAESDHGKTTLTAALTKLGSEQPALAPVAGSVVCPCGLATCVEPWEPGCGLGRSKEHAVRVDNAAQDAKEIDRLRHSRDFYARRCEALQAIQSKMRDPERKAVCDILANGETYAMSEAAPDGFALVPQSALDWLFGIEGEFICPPSRYFRGKEPPYWWRGEFRDRIAAATSAHLVEKP